MTAATNDMVAKMKAEQEYRRIQHEKLDAMRRLVDAWGITTPPTILREEAENMGQIIRDKIEAHKRMISTLEWFAAHLSLDKPESDVLVTRVILEGLAAMEHRARDVPYASAPDPFMNVAQQAMKPWK